jgi:hypothetical protein
MNHDATASAEELKETPLEALAMAHVVIHFFSDTRWSRTLHPVR